MKVAEITRKFKLGMQVLDDPCPGQPIETAVQVLSASHPEINTAAMGEPVIEDGHQVYSFQRAVGTKG